MLAKQIHKPQVERDNLLDWIDHLVQEEVQTNAEFCFLLREIAKFKQGIEPYQAQEALGFWIGLGATHVDHNKVMLSVPKWQQTEWSCARTSPTTLRLAVQASC